MQPGKLVDREDFSKSKLEETAPNNNAEHPTQEAVHARRQSLSEWFKRAPNPKLNPINPTNPKPSTLTQKLLKPYIPSPKAPHPEASQLRKDVDPTP